MKMQQCSETSACKIQKPGNYPKETYKKKEVENKQFGKYRLRSAHSATLLARPLLSRS
jgi:hypothetical protein